MSVTVNYPKVLELLWPISVLKNGKAKAIRFSTLESICMALDRQPGDLRISCCRLNFFDTHIFIGLKSFGEVSNGNTAFTIQTPISSKIVDVAKKLKKEPYEVVIEIQF